MDSPNHRYTESTKKAAIRIIHRRVCAYDRRCHAGCTWSTLELSMCGLIQVMWSDNSFTYGSDTVGGCPVSTLITATWEFWAKKKSFQRQSRWAFVQGRTSLSMLMACTVPCMSFPRLFHHLTRLPICIGWFGSVQSEAKTDNCGYLRRGVHSPKQKGSKAWTEQSRPEPELFYKKTKPTAEE
jgi:hypothetical protein